MFIISTVHYTSSFSVVYLNLLFLNSSLAIVSILEMKCTWQPPTLVQFSQHWCMSVYVCILMLWPCVHSAVGLPYCTLGSQRAGDCVSWVGIWKSWPLVQADCGQPWVQTWAFVLQAEGRGNPYTGHTLRTRDSGPHQMPVFVHTVHCAILRLILL